MSREVVVEKEIYSKLVKFRCGRFALQADGAVLGSIGDTTVLVTACANETIKEGADFVALTVDVEERMYAAGKIPGSFFRREGRASDSSILVSRLIDRPLRPCFREGFYNDVHVVATVLGADLEHPHDIVAINSASLALMLSGVPFDGPIGAIRLAIKPDGSFLVNPTYKEGDEALFEIVIAGREINSEIAIIMVEAGATEEAFRLVKESGVKISEEILTNALEYAKEPIKQLIEMQREVVEKAGVKHEKVFELRKLYPDELLSELYETYAQQVEEALLIASKLERRRSLDNIKAGIISDLSARIENCEIQEKQIELAFFDLVKKTARKLVVNENKRIDGRTPEEIRPLSIEVGLIPTAHGTGLFQRGETQVLSITTLAMPRMNQMLDSITLDLEKRYMHHYYMPPFATGEAAQLRGPKRREIGHGYLAERALLAVVPSQEVFPYTIRVVSEVLSANGSTSMASVCGSSLSLMDAGVPIIAPVAGVAMGLIHDYDNFVTLTDIMGDEDHYGDMDFKVAGTRDFITALQLDTKISGIPPETLKKALEQARVARLKILDAMAQVIEKPRDHLHKNAPKILSFEIPAQSAGDVIGPKGKVINQLQADTATEINIDQSDNVTMITISAKDDESLEKARKAIEAIVSPPEVRKGEVYEGTVVSVLKFGAFVNLIPGRDGLLHISKIPQAKNSAANLDAIMKVGDKVKVVVEDIDANSKISLDLVSPEEKVNASQIEVVSFEEHFENQLKEDLGDLGLKN